MKNKKKKYYVTFGQNHYKTISGNHFNKDTVCLITAEDYRTARAKAFELFDDKFAFMYSEKEWDNMNSMIYFKEVIKL